jgi:hypothetical protein
MVEAENPLDSQQAYARLLNKLADDMRTATAMIETSGIQRSRLMGMKGAVEAAAEFFRALDPTGTVGLARPLVAIGDNLNDLLEGRVPEDFEVAAPQGGARETLKAKHMKLISVIGMQAYIENGLRQREAAERVSRNLPLQPEITADRIIEWRDGHSRRKLPGYSEAYHIMLRQVRNPETGRIPEREIDKILQQQSIRFQGVKFRKPKAGK